MKIGMLSHWFDPEGGAAAGPGTIARALQQRGHDVDVLTGYPIYPAGKVFDGYRIRPYMKERIRDVSVHRVPTYPSHDDNAVRRMANYLSFAASSSFAAPAVFRESDIVFVYSSPATAATAAVPLKLLKQTPYVVQIQDLWPDTISASGFVDDATGSAMERALSVYCNGIYRHAAHIGVISPGMADALTSRGVPSSKISVIPNWAEESSFYPAKRDLDFAASLGIRRDFTVMYAGNLGEMQNLESLIGAAQLLQSRKDIGFALVGAGVRKAYLMDLAKDLGLDNITFVDPQPFERMADVLALADAQVVSLKDAPLYRITLPSKIQANMAAGQPIIAAVSGDAADTVSAAGCGRVVEPGNPEELASAVAELADLSSIELDRLGQRALQHYDRHFSEKSVGDSLESILEQHRRHA